MKGGGGGGGGGEEGEEVRGGGGGGGGGIGGVKSSRGSDIQLNYLWYRLKVPGSHR